MEPSWHLSSVLTDFLAFEDDTSSSSSCSIFLLLCVISMGRFTTLATRSYCIHHPIRCRWVKHVAPIIKKIHNGIRQISPPDISGTRKKTQWALQIADAAPRTTEPLLDGWEYIEVAVHSIHVPTCKASMVAKLNYSYKQPRIGIELGRQAAFRVGGITTLACVSVVAKRLSGVVYSVRALNIIRWPSLVFFLILPSSRNALHRFGKCVCHQVAIVCVRRVNLVYMYHMKYRVP